MSQNARIVNVLRGLIDGPQTVSGLKPQKKLAEATEVVISFLSFFGGRR